SAAVIFPVTHLGGIARTGTDFSVSEQSSRAQPGARTSTITGEMPPSSGNENFPSASVRTGLGQNFATGSGSCSASADRRTQTGPIRHTRTFAPTTGLPPTPTTTLPGGWPSPRLTTIAGPSVL